MMASPTTRNLERHGHFVQFYKADEPLLNRNVGRFLWDGVLRGDALLVIATPERCESLAGDLRRLGAELSAMLARRQFAMLDAREMLQRFMVNGSPDRDLFRTVIQDAMGSLVPRADDGGLCAYGEMVGVLWEAGESAAAILLEDFWNELLHGTGISLFCGYPVDVFAREFQSRNLDAVRCAHSHLISAGDNDSLHAALDQAITDTLGAGADGVRSRMTAAPTQALDAAPSAESSILWLWRNLPESAEGILARARQHYETSREQAS
jgi:hypothetical protein